MHVSSSSCFASVTPQTVPEMPVFNQDLSFIPVASPLLANENQSIALEMQTLSSTTRRAISPKTDDMNRIINDVYLGNLNSCEAWFHHAKENPDKKSVVITATDYALSAKPPANVEHFWLNITDDISAWTGENGLKKNLKTIFGLIDHARINRIPVLVHCLAGRSRSAAVLTTYFMWSCRRSYDTVLAFIKSKRFCAQPSAELKAILSTEYQDMLQQCANMA